MARLTRAALIEEANGTLAQPVTITTIRADDASRIRREVVEKFFDSRWSAPIWDFPTNAATSIAGGDTRLLVGEFDETSPHFVFFHPNDEREALRFESGLELKRVLTLCPPFEFWVCDQPVTYVFCFNHHDYLMAWGRAAEWLTQHRSATDHG